MSRTPSPRHRTWLPPLAEEEFDAVSHLICLRIQDGSMPPDDAYWWTRVLVADAVCALMRNGPDSDDAGIDATARTITGPASS